MKNTFLALAAILAFSGIAVADELIVFPAKDQSKEQQETDEVACFIWAKEETGFDPATAVVEVADPQKKRGGAVRGAALGAVIGDDSDATATGAAVGAARQGRQNRRAAAAADKERARQEAELAEKRERFNKATMACLEAKGYTVK